MPQYWLKGDVNNPKGSVVAYSVINGHGCDACEHCLNHKGEKRLIHLFTNDAMIYKKVFAEYSDEMDVDLDVLVKNPKNPLLGQVDISYYTIRLIDDMKRVKTIDSDRVFTGSYTCVSRCLTANTAAAWDYFNVLSENVDRMKPSFRYTVLNYAQRIIGKN